MCEDARPIVGLETSSSKRDALWLPPTAGSLRSHAQAKRALLAFGVLTVVALAFFVGITQHNRFDRVVMLCACIVPLSCLPVMVYRMLIDRSDCAGRRSAARAERDRTRHLSNFSQGIRKEETTRTRYDDQTGRR